MPNCLIICFKRVAKSPIKIKIEVFNSLYLNNVVEQSNSPKQYKLVDLINKTENYGNVTFSSFINNGQLIDSYGNNSLVFNQTTSLSNDNGDIMIIFYEAC